MLTYIIGSPVGSPYFQVRLWERICLSPSTPTPFNHLFRQMAVVSLLRLHITYYSSNGILTVSSIGIASRLTLRARLTLIRLTLIRKPSSFGGRVSRPPCRYSYLHFLFCTLQSTSQYAFNAEQNAPLPLNTKSM